MAKAATLTGYSPSTTSPLWSTRTRSETRIWPKSMPNGLTQKWSRFSGSRAVMCPATPSSNPNLAKRRKAAANRCFLCSRSSSTELKVGGIGKLKGRDGLIIASSGIGFSIYLSALVKIPRRNRLPHCSLAIHRPLAPVTLVPDDRRVRPLGQQGLPPVQIDARDGEAVSELGLAHHFTLEPFAQTGVSARRAGPAGLD